MTCAQTLLWFLRCIQASLWGGKIDLSTQVWNSNCHLGWCTLVLKCNKKVMTDCNCRGHAHALVHMHTHLLSCTITPQIPHSTNWYHLLWAGIYCCVVDTCPFNDCYPGPPIHKKWPPVVIVIWDGAPWFWTVITTIMTDWLLPTSSIAGWGTTCCRIFAVSEVMWRETVVFYNEVKFFSSEADGEQIFLYILYYASQGSLGSCIV